VIKGYFNRYIFKSEQGYTVGLLKVTEGKNETAKYKNKTITFTGYFHELNEGDLYILEGKFIEHPKFGEQFETESYHMVLPDDKDNIISFLSSDIFPGIGKTKATKIVEVLGKDCLSIILENPSNLMLVPGITEKQKDTIYENLKKYQYGFDTIVTLTKLGFNTKDALLVYNYYKEGTIEIINTNPYLLIDTISEITFKKIEKIRNNLKIENQDINRIKAAMKYTIKEICFKTGSTYLYYEEIINFTNRILFFNDTSIIKEALEELIRIGEICKAEEKYFLTETYLQEKYIARRLFQLANSNSKINIDEKEIEKLEDFYQIKYNDDQRLAIKKGIANDFLVITGGPGTGKTTIINAICKIYGSLYKLNEDDLNKVLFLLAPTGRASKRISEETSLPAYTIHRFLKWNKEENTFRINEENKSDAKIVIIDEASMLDTELLYNLLLGLRNNTKIIMIGDANQLPSVSPGQVLKDIINSGCMDVVDLKTLYRRDEASSITLLAHEIINDTNENIFDLTDENFIFEETNNIKESLKKYIFEQKNNPSFQVLAPIYKGTNGIDELNLFIREILNPLKNQNEIIHEGIAFRENDKVIQLVNSVENNVFNGDIGKIIKISTKKKEIYVGYDSEIVKYTKANFNNIKLAYAISIHKSQGSEFDTVIMPIVNNYHTMLYKKLIYTGITRSKNKLIGLGEKQAFLRGIKNERETNRRTNLKNFIIECIKS